jgi:hypothetical protein
MKTIVALTAAIGLAFSAPAHASSDVASERHSALARLSREASSTSPPAATDERATKRTMADAGCPCVKRGAESLEKIPAHAHEPGGR